MVDEVTARYLTTEGERMPEDFLQLKASYRIAGELSNDQDISNANHVHRKNSHLDISGDTIGFVCGQICYRVSR